ncbi:MAG TPA: hypothetical protein VHB27_12975 [Rhodopila sp.]|uniref:hypothetical protein n=1 Tax=Rhodopila sp. TaxID=2480087 RepID=UPI002C68558E|nr:hypothetical protein [Rhodopila sp.]HVY16130.1 hypothetical protein [Rhodopila sp.]
MRSEPRFHFVILTCRDPDTDFRRPLVEALSALGPTTYAWLRRRPLVSGPATGGVTREMSLVRFLATMARLRRRDAIPVYLNSTNTYFPGMTLVLRLLAPRGVWCFDLHDDLRYHNTGLKRVTESLIVRLLAALSHEIVHAAPTLQRLFPRSRHLGNASHLRPGRRDAARADAVLVIASFDERLDFPFLAAVMRRNPGLTFDLRGWVRADDAPTRKALEALLAACPNAVYHGPYAMADLPDMLAQYKVTLAPYRTGSPLTDYIDPLRFYHCLNAGLEVVSTPIPQAVTMSDCIHVVTDVDTCSATILAVLDGRAAKQPDYAPVTWEQKARRFKEIVLDSQRTQALAAAR